jgi:ferric-dicitrate binding protein FerR (iron transport regulator)
MAAGTEHRKVQLEGEAYFDVRHDPRRPFIVHANDLVAEDLGTEFVVRAYPEDPYGQVIVRKGRVGIGTTVVTPGYLGRLAADGTPVVESADTVSWFAWTRGQLLFKRTPLRDALPQLSRWYDVQFRLADPSFGDRELSGPIPPRLDDNFLKALEVTLGLRLTREGRILTFHPGSIGPS